MTSETDIKDAVTAIRTDIENAFNTIKSLQEDFKDVKVHLILKYENYLGEKVSTKIDSSLIRILEVEVQQTIKY